jgi:hypothetical protein
MKTRFFRLARWRALGVALSAGVVAALAQTSVIFVGDDSGRVGRFDVESGTGTALGNIAAAGFAAAQVIGLAYDPTSNSVLLFDRSANRIYSMNALTGVTTILFSTPGVQLQGGAVVGSIVYGINEGSQKLMAYTMSGTNLGLTGPAYPDHVHSLGVIPDTGQLFVITSGSGVRVVNPDGTPGVTLLAAGVSTAGTPEDVAYFGGNYLLASYSTSLLLMNGTTGATSTLLNSTQLSSMGVTGSISGVAVLGAAIPEPSTSALLAAGGIFVVILAWRRRR